MRPFFAIPFLLIAACASTPQPQTPHERLQAALRKLPGPAYASKEAVIQRYAQDKDWVLEDFQKEVDIRDEKLPDGTPLLLVGNRTNYGATGNESLDAYALIDGQWKSFCEINGTEGGNFHFSPQGILTLQGYWHSSCCTGGFWINQFNDDGSWTATSTEVIWGEGSGSLGDLVVHHAQDDEKTLQWFRDTETRYLCEKEEDISRTTPSSDLWMWVKREATDDIRLVHFTPQAPPLTIDRVDYQPWLAEDVRFDGVRYRTHGHKLVVATSPYGDSNSEDAQRIPGDWVFHLLANPKNLQTADWLFRPPPDPNDLSPHLPAFMDEGWAWMYMNHPKDYFGNNGNNTPQGLFKPISNPLETTQKPK